MTRIPSVLGGMRPVVRDRGRDVQQRISYLRAEVAKAKNRLQDLKGQLERAEQEKDLIAASCGCKDKKNCSACS